MMILFSFTVMIIPEFTNLKGGKKRFIFVYFSYNDFLNNLLFPKRAFNELEVVCIFGEILCTSLNISAFSKHKQSFK